jgi:hypothetical protein
MLDKPPHYRSYVLTVWEERSHDPRAPPVWRCSLRDPRTGRQRGFASLQALVAVLEREMVVERDGSSGTSQGPGR